MPLIKKVTDDNNQWISTSDLMSGLMMIFLLITISYMIIINREKEKIKDIAVTYNRLQDELFQDLEYEFKDDLKDWNAEIDRQSLSVKFRSPEVLFNLGSSMLQPRYKEVLNDFFPRFVRILTSKKYKNDIEEIRIEGHTSSEWSYEVPEEEAYFNNMRLSQDRTREVLKYVLEILPPDLDRKWVKSRLTANGLSSSKLVFVNGVEDKEKSRRVEFRVRTNAELRIIRILSAEK